MQNVIPSFDQYSAGKCCSQTSHVVTLPVTIRWYNHNWNICSIFSDMERLKTRTARLRQLEETLLLEPRGIRAAELSRQLRVNRRTVYRDLDFLAEQGVPLWQENGIFGINRTRYQTTVRLTYNESVALVLAGLLLARTFDERNPHVITALRRLAVTLPEPLTAQLERAALRTQTKQANNRHTAVRESIAEGWGTGHKVHIAYCSPKGNILHDRIIAPYTLEP